MRTHFAFASFNEIINIPSPMDLYLLILRICFLKSIGLPPEPKCGPDDDNSRCDEYGATCSATMSGRFSICSCENAVEGLTSALLTHSVMPAGVLTMVRDILEEMTT